MWQFCMEMMCFQSQYFQLKNNTPVFRKRFLFSRKFVSKLKVLKIFKIFTDCHIKTYRSLKRRAIFKIPSAVFQKKLCSFCWLQDETSKKKRFPVLREKPTQILPKTCWKEQPFIFSVYLMDHIFQTSVLLIFDNRMCRT